MLTRTRSNSDRPKGISAMGNLITFNSETAVNTVDGLSWFPTAVYIENVTTAKNTGDTRMTEMTRDMHNHVFLSCHVSSFRILLTSLAKATSQPYALTMRTPPRSSLVNLTRASARFAFKILNFVVLTMTIAAQAMTKNIAPKPPKKLAPITRANITMAKVTMNGAISEPETSGADTRICSVSLAAKLLIMPEPVALNPTLDNRTILVNTAPIMAPRTFKAASMYKIWEWFLQSAPPSRLAKSRPLRV
mmetsp:Transcript_60715/g.185439  ORF Transcript_60715/g.185439 Transcript_60715/m.185439 type:complete len:248 (+) Transcript_60715:2315-3058(+)